MRGAKQTKRKSRRWWILLFVLIVTTGVFSQTSVFRRLTGEDDGPQTVLTAPVRRVKELRSTVSATGQIQAKNSVDLQTEIAGIIVELPVEEGDRVEEGQVLVRIDPEQTLSDVRGARAQTSAAAADAESALASVAVANADLAQAESQLKSSRVELEQNKLSLLRSEAQFKRSRELFENQLLSPEEFEIAETQARIDRARVAAAEAGIEQAKARIEAQNVGIEQAESQATASQRRTDVARATLRRLEDLLKKTTIRSPLTGLVVRRNVNLGERAVPGVLSNPQATLLTIADLSAIEAHLEVDETDIVSVSIDDPAVVVVDAIPDENLVGIVTEIGNSPINLDANEAKDFRVVVQLDSPPEPLRPGLSCSADITIEIKKDVLVVPIASLVIREVYVDESGDVLDPVDRTVERDSLHVVNAAEGESTGQEKEEREGVFVLDSRKRARFRPIETGITSEIEIEVVRGLKEGEIILTGPYSVLRNLKDGDPVESDADFAEGEEE